MNQENENEHLQPCELFTLLESRRNQNLLRCDVCDHIEDAHANAGRRVLKGEEVEELRRLMLVARFEKMQEERRRKDPPVPSENGGKATSPGSNE
ncbi:MAG: hypothetical protein ACREML_01455 [Vulcanimicrobiaceae bacterium]